VYWEYLSVDQYYRQYQRCNKFNCTDQRKIEAHYGSIRGLALYHPSIQPTGKLEIILNLLAFFLTVVKLSCITVSSTCCPGAGSTGHIPPDVKTVQINLLALCRHGYRT